MTDTADFEVAAVGDLLDRIGLDAIVDVHTHFMPKRVMDKVWAYFDGIGPQVGRQWPIEYRTDEAERVQRLRQFRVTAFTSLVYPHKPAMAEWLNSWATQFAAQVPECLHTATFYPEPSAPAYVRQVIDAGARVFKAHIQVGDYSPTESAASAGVGAPGRDADPHGDPRGVRAAAGPAHRSGSRSGGPAPASGAATVIAHMGLPEYREFIELARRYPGVYLDTTMAFTAFIEQTDPFPVDARPALVELADKVLFGSDFPNIPYRYHHALESITGLGLGDEWCRKVLHDNARSLFPPVGAVAGD